MDYNETNILSINETVEDNANIVKEKKDYLKKLVKRIIDISASIVGITILVPISLVVYIRNKIKKENKKIFFIQERIGKDGKPFKLYKFQTMIDNADDILEDYFKTNKEAKKEWEEKKKITNDPRVTAFGKILRKTSLDEFPQFINVLKGDMSLVGPRPYLPREKEDMQDYYFDIVKCKPGLTGPWQVSGRSNINFEDRLKIDSEYVSNSDNVSEDIKIVFKTIDTALFKKDGAI